MTIPRISVGLRRVSSTTPRSAAQATRAMRAQMKSVKSTILKLIRDIDNVTPLALAEGLQPIFDESQRLVPVDTGDLKVSGFLTTGTFRGKPSVNIGYAAQNKPDYAIYVHEDLNAQHASPTQAKFLEQPFKEQLDEIAPRIRKALAGSLGANV